MNPKNREVRRLSKADWLRAGLEVLAASGPRELKAVRLARILGVTTGSFYWHFDSVAEFRAELQRYWKDEFLVGLAREAQRRAERPERELEELARLIRARKEYRYDDAMRSWAEFDAGARRAVEEADSWRQRLLTKLIRQTGVDSKDATDRAAVMSAVWVGTRGTANPGYRLKLIGLAAAPNGRSRE